MRILFRSATMSFRCRNLVLVCAALAAVAGCPIKIDNDNNNSNSNSNSNGNGGGGGNTVRVRVVNATGTTVDPEIFVTGNAVTDPAQLFSADLMFRAAAGTGIARCTEQGFRYVIPSVGLQARW